MKQTLLITCFCLIASFIKAQPTITSANSYEAGDVLSVQYSDTFAVEGPAGANQTWDFSTIPAVGAPVDGSVVLASSTPYAASFPGANLATEDVAGSGIFAYFLSNSTTFELAGIGTPSLLYPYDDFQKYFVYPCTYNTTFSDVADASWILNSVPTTRSVTASFIADAYGTLKLPGKTINNTLRVKYDQTITDVAEILGNPFTTVTHIVQYAWYVPGTKGILMNIIYSDTEADFGPTIHTKIVSYSAGAVSVNPIEAAASSIHLFPNPSTDQITFSCSIDEGAKGHLSVYNVSGQIVKSVDEKNFSAGIHTEEIMVGDLESGTYFLRLEMMNRKPVTVRFVKD